MSLREEVTELLQELIRLDTVNPPGNETRAAEVLERYLARNGVATRRFAKTSDRANVVARLEGEHVVSYLHKTSPDLPAQIGVLVGVTVLNLATYGPNWSAAGSSTASYAISAA